MASEPDGGRAVAGLFKPLQVVRASHDVVRQIKEAIHAGRLRPGDGLPSERELTQRFGISRVTVRDALRTLEATGLIEIRVGARGGAFVRVPGPEHVGDGFTNMMLLSDLSPEEVTEARMIIERGAVPLACRRRTDDDLAALDEICDRSVTAVEEGRHDVALSAEFHIRLASCAHNDAIELLVNSFQEPLLMSLSRAMDVAPEMGARGVREHRALVEAIRRQDVAAADRLMSAHLGRTAARLGGARTSGEAVGRD
ncbi:GntR family transcriptional regulator [Actinomadura sp. NBRC 104412]|uniref:FadR/GntR family transcriptional regulator n=1 Tax=Actinomadura sp. NBRC 104412 TaxID=3032203 RepID=UPI0024A20672|nr:FadR/GntR family transcriptional regulator [Actinomadura sp. NBRC 104412]GLZ07808.1 GntR family transcriptional regulator [Actinomadura sp. NBRC 104412]